MKRILITLTLLIALLTNNARAYLTEADCEEHEGAGKCSKSSDGSWHKNSALAVVLNYGGSLSSNNAAINGNYDLVFQLFDGPVGATNITMTATNFSVAVTNGQFRAVVLGWYPDDFAGPNPHLEISLRRSGSGAPFVTLSPRQQLADLPRAVVAQQALTIPTTALGANRIGTNWMDGIILQSGTVQADKIAAAQVVKGLNGLRDDVTLLAGAGVSLNAAGNTITMSALPPLLSCFDYTNCYWNLLGNGNVIAPLAQSVSPGAFNFLGTIVPQPLELRVNKWRGLRLEPTGPLDAPNFIGGYYDNAVLPATVVGASIGGGGSDTLANRVTGNYGTIGGGRGHVAANHATVSGGRTNLASGNYSTVGVAEPTLPAALLRRWAVAT